MLGTFFPGFIGILVGSFAVLGSLSLIAGFHTGLSFGVGDSSSNLTFFFIRENIVIVWAFSAECIGDPVSCLLKTCCFFNVGGPWLLAKPIIDSSLSYCKVLPTSD